MTEDLLGALGATVREWITADPDPTTRSEASDLLELALTGDTAAEARLRDAFDGRLSFGTAGLRAELGAGPRRMNRVVVAQSSAGLSAWLLANRSDHDAGPASVVIGYDGRVNSEVFARDTAEIMAGAGLKVTLFHSPVPTPLVSFAVRYLDATAGVMITASHNPARDNGYKVYLAGGRQVAPPLDHEITEAIATAASLPLADLPRSTEFITAGPDIINSYVQETAEAIVAGLPNGDPRGEPSTGSAPTVVYTAMHGVGAEIARAVFASASLPAVISVVEQDQPDGAFPTLEYPNPEEPGALDLAIALAQKVHASCVIAHDPDADRLAIAAPHPEAPEGYRRLTGNELGLLLGWRAAERARTRKIHDGVATDTLANTIVSSPALGAIARAYGLKHVETLPGFKWISQVPGLAFGFEEALGYLTTPDIVGDKDGISAAADALALAAELHSIGGTLWQLLDRASEEFGHFASTQVVIRCEQMAEIEALSTWVRNNPPLSFGDYAVARVRDFHEPGLAPVPANVLAYDLTDGSRVMIRPSGTEPKLKVYIDAFCDVGSAAERRATAAETLTRIEAAARAYLDGATKGALR